MRFDDVNYIDLKDVYLHDAEVGLVTVSYKDQTATVELRYTGHYDATLLFTNVRDVDILIDEPWGGGIYVSGAEANKLNDDPNDVHFMTAILLNSGDEITVVAKELILEGYIDPRPRFAK